MLSIITGASSGIGFAIAMALASEGYTIATLSRNRDRLNFLRSALHSISPGRNHILLHGDLLVASDTDKFYADIKQTGRIPDLIVNCAGIYVTDLPSEITEEKLKDQIDINFISAFRITKPWLEAFKQRRNGRIISIGSIVTHRPRVSATSYTLSKSLLDCWMALLSAELHPIGPRIVRIAPDSVLTPSWDNEPEESKKGILKPADIVEKVISLLAIPDYLWPEEIVIEIPLLED